MRENLMSGSMWQGMKTRHGDGTEALSEEMERNGSATPKSRRHPLTLPPDKCGRLPALSGKAAPTADSASGGFVRQFPPLPVTPAVGTPLAKQKESLNHSFALSSKFGNANSFFSGGSLQVA